MASTPDTTTSAIGGFGIATQLAGTIGQYEEGQAIANTQQQGYQQTFQSESQISGLEQQVQYNKQQQMQLSSRRQNVEDFRQSQMARAKGVTNAAASGNTFSSSAATGQGNATSQGLFNSEGVNQNLQIGQNIFALNNQENAAKLQMSLNQTQTNTQLSQENQQNSMFGGISSFGGAITKAAPMLAAMLA